MREVNNSEDVLDSRGVIARRDELKEEREGLVSDVEDARQEEDNDQPEDRAGRVKDAEDALKEWDEENAEELAALEAFIDEGSSSWEDGETLVRESYFEDYARELADDVVENFRERSSQWPFSCIDWEQAARELQHDYTGADFDGVTYYYRA